MTHCIFMYYENETLLTNTGQIVYHGIHDVDSGWGVHSNNVVLIVVTDDNRYFHYKDVKMSRKIAQQYDDVILRTGKAQINNENKGGNFKTYSTRSIFVEMNLDDVKIDVRYLPRCINVFTRL